MLLAIDSSIDRVLNRIDLEASRDIAGRNV
jgi:hypothetical protein